MYQCILTCSFTSTKIDFDNRSWVCCSSNVSTSTSILITLSWDADLRLHLDLWFQGRRLRKVHLLSWWCDFVALLLLHITVHYRLIQVLVQMSGVGRLMQKIKKIFFVWSEGMKTDFSANYYLIINKTFHWT